MQAPRPKRWPCGSPAPTARLPFRSPPRPAIFSAPACRPLFAGQARSTWPTSRMNSWTRRSSWLASSSSGAWPRTCRADISGLGSALAAACRQGQVRPSARIGVRVLTVRILALIFRRLAVFALGAFSIWLIVFVFRFTDSRAPTILALSLVYALAAYVLLPRIVRMSLKILQRKSVPSFTLTGDGFPGDPVNLVLMGEFSKLRAAFLAAGWTEAQPLNLTSSWRMVVAFVLNRSYPAAPFSTLFLFGRAQDVGFQKAIDMSPRKRHHVRFWALSLTRNDEPLNNPDFWLNADRPPIDEPALWVGAGTRDTGLSFTKFTFQFTHATADDVNTERDFIISELERNGAIGEVAWRRAGETLVARVNHYVTDGDVAAANLT